MSFVSREYWRIKCDKKRPEVLTCFPSVKQNQHQQSSQQRDAHRESCGDVQASCWSFSCETTSAAIKWGVTAFHLSEDHLCLCGAITDVWWEGWRSAGFSPRWLDSAAHSWTLPCLHCPPESRGKLYYQHIYTCSFYTTLLLCDWSTINIR